MKTSVERKRVVAGGLLIAASVGIGATSDGWAPVRDADAPMLPVMDVYLPYAATTPTTTPTTGPSASSDGVPSTRVVKDAALPAPADAVLSESIATEPLLVLEGGASWYSDALAGRPTASGEPYDPTELIAAHRALPFGTRLRVTNLENDRSVEVRVVDRGPFITGRIVDLSRSAAAEIGILRAGHGRVRVEVLEYGS